MAGPWRLTLAKTRCPGQHDWPGRICGSPGLAAALLCVWCVCVPDLALSPLGLRLLLGPVVMRQPLARPPHHQHVSDANINLPSVLLLCLSGSSFFLPPSIHLCLCLCLCHHTTPLANITLVHATPRTCAIGGTGHLSQCRSSTKQATNAINSSAKESIPPGGSQNSERPGQPCLLFWAAQLSAQCSHLARHNLA